MSQARYFFRANLYIPWGLMLITATPPIFKGSVQATWSKQAHSKRCRGCGLKLKYAFETSRKTCWTDARYRCSASMCNMVKTRRTYLWCKAWLIRGKISEVHQALMKTEWSSRLSATWAAWTPPSNSNCGKAILTYSFWSRSRGIAWWKEKNVLSKRLIKRRIRTYTFPLLQTPSPFHQRQFQIRPKSPKEREGSHRNRRRHESLNFNRKRNRKKEAITTKFSTYS